jgi:DNA-binding LytR/AlgR family response regulator
MRTIRSLIIEDEEAARQRLRRLLEAHPEVDIAGETGDGIEALNAIERLRPELLFLDIQMPGLTGFEVLRNLPAGVERPLIIFITGYHEHALEAFRARAIAYLLKPVKEDHLAEMIDRAHRLLNSNHSDADEANIDGLLRENGRITEQIVGRKANRTVLLNPSEALFFYMDAGMVRVRMDDETYWVNYQMGELEEALAGKGFFRAHRSSLVNLKRVKEIRSGIRSSLVLVMADSQSTEVEVSERQGRVLRERIPGL